MTASAADEGKYDSEACVGSTASTCANVDISDGGSVCDGTAGCEYLVAVEEVAQVLESCAAAADDADQSEIDACAAADLATGDFADTVFF